MVGFAPHTPHPRRKAGRRGYDRIPPPALPSGYAPGRHTVKGAGFARIRKRTAWKAALDSCRLGHKLDDGG